MISVLFVNFLSIISEDDFQGYIPWIIEINVTANNSIKNNVVFFFDSDLKIAFYTNS